MNFVQMRKSMIEEQLMPRGIKDEKVLAAFAKVPRHEFVSKDLQDSSYDDNPLPIGESQTISQPFIVALMTQCLDLKNNEKVLEVGAGSGYQTAILAELAKEVYSVERIESLAVSSVHTLERLGYKNFKIVTGDGTLGWAEHAPYDGIIVTAGSPTVPESLVKQLKDGGRMVIPVGNGFMQVLTVVKKEGGIIKKEEICGCAFVPLIGEEGWRS